MYFSKESKSINIHTKMIPCNEGFFENLVLLPDLKSSEKDVDILEKLNDVKIYMTTKKIQ
mgnify:CR=1 FL=1